MGKHTTTIDGLVSTPDDGLLIGNGELSASVYQKADRIIWRLGKNDVWDRRFDASEDPDPLTMDELRHGLKEEGWAVPPYGGEPVATRGTDNPQRMKETLRMAPSYLRPYPMPKPVGELSLRYNGDLPGMQIRQQLHIEQGRITIDCTWRDGESLKIACWIATDTNALVVEWTSTGVPSGFADTAPLHFSLYRWRDPSIEEFSDRWQTDYSYDGFKYLKHAASDPLPLPSVIEHKGRKLIEQKFYPDPLFPDGFRYWMGALSSLPVVQQYDTGSTGEANLYIGETKPDSFEFVIDISKDADASPVRSGWIVVPVATSGDEGGCAGAMDAIVGRFKSAEDIAKSSCLTGEAADRFFAASSVRLGESLLEDFWYESLHAARCVMGNGPVPIGLFFPSTLRDYALWHGDYHTNYNIQQPFWGVHAANHPELAEAYFQVMRHLDNIGQKIAHDYCGTRGTFIQISGYPIAPEHDPFPTAPMGRMAYMTGWAPEIHWFHYLYTGDQAFLCERAYPFIRDCALFYTDFLQLGDDGLYHAFPASWGEEGYTGDYKYNVDARQTIEYAASVMRIATAAARELKTDTDLQTAWQDRIARLAPGQGKSEWEPLPEAAAPRHQQHNVPAFRPAFLAVRFGCNDGVKPHWSLARRFWNWTDKLTISLIRDMRGGQFLPERDFIDLLRVIDRWRRPNGLFLPMPIRIYGHCGAWTEGLGLLAPLNEMLLQSWDGTIRVFPGWPTDKDASFTDLAAEGAFLVSAELSGGAVQQVRIRTHNGGTCRLVNPWPGGKVTIAGRPVTGDLLTISLAANEEILLTL